VGYTYDSQHRLTERVHHDVDGAEIYHLVVGPRDDEGNPLSMTVTQPPVVLFGVPLPATGHTTFTFSYDDLGRLVTSRRTFADGVVFVDETISYDDVELRRDHVVIVDGSEEFGHGTGPGYNTMHEFLDATGRLLEVTGTVAGDSGGYAVDYRYDESSRMSKMIAARNGKMVTVDYMYECP
jgi:hypothetical protein